jgi:glucose/mannose-6-phosphate isomerase
MVDIDNLNEMRRIDTSGLLGLTERFPEQLKEASQIAEKKLSGFSCEPENIIICGMGGSAIGGDIVSAWAWEKYGVPVIVNRDYTLPAFCKQKSLVITASYSGNTEETISAYDEAIKRGARVVAISSGGLLEKKAVADGVLHIKIPAGMPPRGATAYMLVPQLLILGAIGVQECTSEIEESIAVCRKQKEALCGENPTDRNPAKAIAKRIVNTVPNIFGNGISAPIAKRWRTQLNENSKMIAREDVFPEMNHNDTVGWSGDAQPQRFSVVILRHKYEFERNKMRIELTKSLVLNRANTVIEVWGEGVSRLANMLSLMHVGDFVSVYIALLRDIDPTPVPVIEQLKKLLAEKKA